MAKVNQSYSELVDISPAALFCFEICFWKLAAVCEKLSCYWVWGVKTSAAWESDGNGGPGLQIEGRYLEDV